MQLTLQMRLRMILQLILAAVAYCEVEDEIEVSHTVGINGSFVYELELNEQRALESPSFPLCCTDATYLIKCVRENNLACYIRLTFTDLDLAAGSILHIFDGDSDNAKLLDDQPEIQRGMWYRPAVSSSGKALYIKFEPNKLRSSSHIGFRANILSTASPEVYWHNKPTSDGCGFLKSAFVGSNVTLDLPHNLDLGIHSHDHMMQDCVWLLKPPSTPSDLYAFARFTILNLNGIFEVREGITSKGKILAGGVHGTFNMDSAALSFQGTMGFHSRKGLYIRVQVETERDHPALLFFIFGVYQKAKKSDSSCQFAGNEGYLCKDEKAVCFPIQYMCNSVENCPDGSDEGYVCNPTTTSPPTTTTTQQHLTMIGCPEFCLTCYADSREKCLNCKFPYDMDSYGLCSRCALSSMTKCASGECISEWRKCPEDSCPANQFKCNSGECKPQSYKCDNYDDCSDGSDELGCANCDPYYEKKCDDGTCVGSSDYCPGESCPYDRPNSCDSGQKCYPDYYKCDDACDCTDCTDEDDCSSSYDSEFSSTNVWWVGLITPGILLCCVLPCACYIRRRRTRARMNRGARGDTSAAAPPYSGTRMVPIAPTATAGYTPVPATTITNDSEYPQGTGGYTPSPASAPPPSYDEVAENRTMDTMPPPPSYESVAASAPSANSFPSETT